MEKGIAYSQGPSLALMWRVGKVFKKPPIENPFLDKGVYIDVYKCPNCGYIEFWEEQNS